MFEVCIIKELAASPQPSEGKKNSGMEREEMNKAPANSPNVEAQGKVKSGHVGCQKEYNHFNSNLVGPSQSLTNSSKRPNKQ